jgi:hypothetical protein
MRRLVAVLAFALCGAAGADEWSDADRATPRLAAAEVPELPAPVRADLERRGCRIPQAFSHRKPANFARGSFLGTDREDWAVLCSIERASRILVYAGGTTQRVLEVPGSLRQDADYLREVGGGRIGFSRNVTAIAPVQAHRRQTETLGRVMVRLKYAGIEDAFLEKGSRVHYFNGMKWMQAQGRE